MIVRYFLFLLFLPIYLISADWGLADQPFSDLPECTTGWAPASAFGGESDQYIDEVKPYYPTPVSSGGWAIQGDGSYFRYLRGSILDHRQCDNSDCSNYTDYYRVFYYGQYVKCSPTPYCDPGYHYDVDISDCVVDCDPQTSVMFNGVCTKCPPNSHPNADHTGCDCDSGYNYSQATQSCTRCDPPDVYNPSTGKCDTTDCNPDSIPVWEGNDYRCASPCPATFLQSNDCACRLPYVRTPTLGIGYNSSTGSTEPVYTCENPDLNSTDPNNPTDPTDLGSNSNQNDDPTCPHPPTLYDEPFIGIMTFPDCQYRGGWSHSCPDSDKVACYKSENNSTDPNAGDSGSSENNSTAAGSTDSNSTPPSDNNVSNLLDQERNTKLDSIIDKLEQSNQIAKENANSLTAGMQNIGDKLDTINGTLKYELGQLGDGLGGKLDQIRDAISNQPTTDMTETNDLLRSIDDRLHEDSQDNIDQIDGLGDQLNLVLQNALQSSYLLYNDVSTVMTGYAPPPIASSSGSCSLSVSLLGKTVDIGKGLRDSFPIFRPVVLFVLNIYFLILLVKLSIFAWRDVSRMGFNLFN